MLGAVFFLSFLIQCTSAIVAMMFAQIVRTIPIMSFTSMVITSFLCLIMARYNVQVKCFLKNNLGFIRRFRDFRSVFFDGKRRAKCLSFSSQVMIFPSDSAAASFFSVVLGPGYAVPAIWKIPEPASQSIRLSGKDLDAGPGYVT